MALEIRPLKPVTNAEMLDSIRAGSSLDYQRRIPAATQAGVQNTIRALQDYRPAMNEFMDTLVNQIGAIVARNISWQNPLAKFKRGLLQYGDTIEEIQSGLLKAHTYDPKREYLERDIFGTETPEVQANFHRVNRQDFYKITINDALLQRAFLDPSGLQSFITQLMEAPMTSDQVDEFLLTTQLFAEMENAGGFYHVNVPDVRAITSDAADAKIALRKMRAMADTLKFVSSRYNAAHMPSFANADELELFVTPEFNAAIDVEALAGAFNTDRASMHGRINPIPAERLNIPGAQAILTTRDFFVIADQRIENTSAANPVGLHSNYFLHHWQIISASRFVPAVMFWTGQDDEVIEIQPQVSAVESITVKDREDSTVTTVERGEMYAAYAVVETNPDGSPNDSVRWSLTGAENLTSYVTQSGVLVVSPREASDTLTLTATSTWIDPETQERREHKSLSVTLTVTGESLPQWPVEATPADESAAEPGDEFPAEATVTAQDATNAAKLAGLGFVASPTTAWDADEYILVGAYAFYWTGTAWAAGEGPAV